MLRKFLLCFAAGVTALSLGVGIFYAGEYLVSIFQTEEIVKTVETAAVEPQEIPFEDLIYQQVVAANEATEENETRTEVDNAEFNPEGYYYIIGNKPKEFEDAYELVIAMTDYERESPENNYDDTMPPEGFLSAKTKFNFVRLSIGNKKIAFVTETKKGISYEFIGEFIEGEKITYTTNYGFDQTEFAVLRGTLIKKRDGKKIAESKVKLAAGGC